MEGKNLTTGNLLKNMTFMLIPILLTNLLNSIYNIVDSIWIGNLIGEAGVSVITNSFPITLVMSSISIGLATAVSVNISQYYGAKNEEKIKQIIGVSYLFNTFIAIISIIILKLSLNFWLTIMNTPEEIFNLTNQYLTIYLIGFVFNFIFTIIMEEFRAIGNTKITLVFVAISSILNIILDPILIKIGLGIKGAALATAISMFVGMVIEIFYINKKSSLLKIDFKYIKWNSIYIVQLLKIGVPVILQELVFAIGFFVEVKTSNRSGVIGSAGYGIVTKLEDILHIISGAFKTMIIVTVGQFVGNHKINEVKQVMKQGLKLAIVPMLITVIVLFIFPKQFCRLFVSSEEVISMAMIYLSVLRFALIAIPIRFLLRGVIIGTGHTTFSLLQIIISLLVEISSLLFLTKYNLESLFSLGIAVTLFMVSELIINFLYYFSNKWKKEVIKQN